jgi:uncharacterized protein YbjT (DUF2867 family)
MLHKRKILIIGGTGTIGGYLLQQLLPDRDRLEIITAARNTRTQAKLEALGYSTVRMDLDDHISILPALEGVDLIFTLNSYSIDFLIHSKRLIDAAQQAGTSHIIDVSSMAPRDLPYAPMGWNRLVDAYLMMSGINYTILHPNIFMDNILKFIDRDAGMIRHLIGTHPAGWIAAKDIARVAAAIIRRPAPYARQIIPLATDRRSFPEIVALINQITGRNYQFETLAPEPTLAMMIKNGSDRAQAAPLVAYYHKISKGEVPYFGDLADPLLSITGKKATLWTDFIEEHREALLF